MSRLVCQTYSPLSEPSVMFGAYGQQEIRFVEPEKTLPFRMALVRIELASIALNDCDNPEPENGQLPHARNLRGP